MLNITKYSTKPTKKQASKLKTKRAVSAYSKTTSVKKNKKTTENTFKTKKKSAKRISKKEKLTPLKKTQNKINKAQKPPSKNKRLAGKKKAAINNSSPLIINQRNKQTTNQSYSLGSYMESRNKTIDAKHKQLKKNGIVFHYNRSEKQAYTSDYEPKNKINNFVRLGFVICLFIAAMAWIFLKMFN